MCLPWVLHQIDLCRMNDALLFARIDTGGSTAKICMLAEAHFDKDQYFAIKRNAVDLAAAHPVVSLNNAQTGALEVRDGQILGVIAGLLFVGAHVILRFLFYFKQF